MTKKELMMQRIEWEIEAANSEIADAVRSINVETKTANYAAINTIGIQHAAMRIAENQTKLRQLHETKRMLEMLESEA